MATTDTGYCQQAAEMPKKIISPMREPVVIPIVQEETDYQHGPWGSAQAVPGLEDLRWFESNPPEVAAHTGQWVAIKNTAVVRSGASFAEVHEAVSADGINQALIVYVRAQESNVYDIA